MGMRIAVCCLLVVGLVGCATSGEVQNLEIQNQSLRMQVSRLKKEVDVKDAEIANLKTTINKEQATKADLLAELQGSKAKDLSQATPKDIQRALKNAGFYDYFIDGKIGEKTKLAIIEFQKAKNLKVDGVIGQETWSALLKYLD